MDFLTENGGADLRAEVLKTLDSTSQRSLVLPARTRLSKGASPACVISLLVKGEFSEGKNSLHRYVGNLVKTFPRHENETTTTDYRCSTSTLNRVPSNCFPVYKEDANRKVLSDPR